jgi:alpha-glucosidase (family GH31 glycosyl hydrolase)
MIYYKTPFESVFLDIDHNENNQTFTLNKNFLNVNTEIRIIPNINPTIIKSTENKIYSIGIMNNLFLMSNKTQSFLIGYSWVGHCVYFDFYNKKLNTFWAYLLKQLFKSLKYDGIWLDMNEPSNFINGESENNDPVNILGLDLNHKTISFDSYSLSNKKIKMLEIKVLYGHIQSKLTYQFLINKFRQRPFVLTRSTTYGTGKYAFHWLGDNESTWESLKDSISGVFNFQIFGFSLVGADICGFFGNSDEKLCLAWTALGAFYPFSRNHNHIDSISQFPYNYNHTIIKKFNYYLYLRYRLIRNLYTCLFQMSMLKNICFKPYFSSFDSYSTILLDDTQVDELFLFSGNNILVIPNLNKASKLIYLENENWFDFINFIPIRSYKDIIKKPFKRNKFNYNQCMNKFINKQNLYYKYDENDVDYPKFHNTYHSDSSSSKKSKSRFFKHIIKFNLDEYIKIIIKGGSIILLSKNKEPQNINDVVNSPSEILISLDKNRTAKGEFIFDDGISLDTIKNKEYLSFDIRFTANYNIIVSKLNSCLYKFNDILIDTIYIAFLPIEIKTVKVILESSIEYLIDMKYVMYISRFNTIKISLKHIIKEYKSLLSIKRIVLN